MNDISQIPKIAYKIQVDPSGQRLYFVDFDFGVTRCCLHGNGMPILPYLQLPKADIRTAKLKLTKCSRRPHGSTCTSLCVVRRVHPPMALQVMEDSRPWLDMAHVVSSLNRLDAGVPDKVCLMSRDEQNVLVVSYGELKHCLEQSFAECVHSQKPAIPGMTHPGNSHHGHALPGGY